MPAVTERPRAPARPAPVPTGSPQRTPAPSRTVGLGYVPGLDGLRAVAVLAVMLYHAGISWMPGGFLGVDVFFVISGFLITSLLLAEHRNQGALGFRQFYLRRARRLLPALFLVLAGVSLYTLVFLPGEVTKLRGDVAAACTYLTNWWFVFKKQSYFDFTGRQPMLQHLWSLAVEEQFYLVWPLAIAGMLRLWRGRRRPMLAITLGGALASTLLMSIISISHHYPVQDPSRAYFGTDTHSAGLLIGASLALVWSPWRLSRRTGAGGALLLDGIGLLGLAGLVWMFVEVGAFSSGLYRGGGFLVCAVLSAVLIAAIMHPAARIDRALGCQPLRWVGERSYGLYLWHWPVFLVTRPQLDVSITGTANLALRFGITVVLAELSYRYVEQPVRRGAIGRYLRALREARGPVRTRLVSRALLVTGAIGGGGTLIAIGLATSRPAPVAPGIDVQAAAAETPAVTVVPPSPAPAVTGGAGTGAGGPQAAPPPAAPGVPRVTAIGDSVMLGARAALIQRLGDVYVDTQKSRQFGTALDIVRALRQQGRLGDIVVIHMGTNGVITSAQVDALMDVLKDRRKVVFLNLKVPRGWEGPDNDTLAAAVARHPNAVLVDWHTLGGAHPELFYQDGIHLKPEGARFYADLIAQQTDANP